MNKGTVLGAIFGVALALGIGGKAEAALVTGAGDTFDLDFAGTVSGVNLSAEGTLTFTAVSTTQFTAVLSLTNTTPVGTTGTNRLISFGFEIGGSATTTAASSANADWGASVNSNITGGFNSIDVCTFDTNSCNAASPGAQGIFEGQTDGTTLTVTGTFPIPFEITDVVVRFASVGAGSEGSGILIGTITPPNPVPEPASMALLGTGLLGLGLMRRRKAA